jgi:glucan-binding YG repeat protein
MKKGIILILLSSMLLTSIGASAGEYKYTGWYNGKTQYMVNNQLVKNGTIFFGGKLYYFNDVGNLENGWNRDVYFKDGLIVTGWQLINNKWYYFSEFGIVARNTTIDGYYVNQNGEYVK